MSSENNLGKNEKKTVRVYFNSDADLNNLPRGSKVVCKLAKVPVENGRELTVVFGSSADTTGLPTGSRVSKIVDVPVD